MVDEKTGAVYEVLSPWAEADPIPLYGLAGRIEKIQDRKIGLLQNGKRAAPPILDVTERLLKEKYPGVQISRFIGTSMSVPYDEPQRIPEFEEWLKEVDAVITAVAD